MLSFEIRSKISFWFDLKYIGNIRNNRRAKQGTSQNKGWVGGKKCCCERTEALRELTGKGQCTAKRGAHVHDKHAIIWMEPLWSLVIYHAKLQWTLPKKKDTL